MSNEELVKRLHALERRMNTVYNEVVWLKECAVDAGYEDTEQEDEEE